MAFLKRRIRNVFFLSLKSVANNKSKYFLHIYKTTDAKNERYGIDKEL